MYTFRFIVFAEDSDEGQVSAQNGVQVNNNNKNTNVVVTII